MFSPKLQDVNCVPWSACRMVGPLRVLLSTAMLTALLTSAVSAVVEKVRATIIREKQSRIAQQYTLPSRAGCSVMSYADPRNMPILLAMVHVSGGFEVQKVGIVA